MAYYQLGRTQGAPRRPIEEELNDVDLNLSMDDISVGGVTKQNQKINEFFSDNDCCRDNTNIIESDFIDNHNKTLFLFINEKKTHYILFEKPINLDKIHQPQPKPKPLIMYNNLNINDNKHYFTIIHDNIAYFFTMTNNNTIKREEYFQLSRFKSKDGKDLFFCLYEYDKNIYILFEKDESGNYIAASNFIELSRYGNFISLIYNGIIYNGVENKDGKFTITEAPPYVFSTPDPSFKSKSNKRSTKRSKQVSTKRSNKRSNKRSKQRSNKRSNKRSKPKK